MEHQPKVRKDIVAKTKKKKVKTPTLTNMLPEDVIVKIVVKLVSSSPHPFADLCSLIKTCKAFFVASKDKMVKQQIALEREVDVLTWKLQVKNHQIMGIYNSCANAGNAEANFMLALINMSVQGNINGGVELLKKASSNNHKGALYLMNILRVRNQNLRLSCDVNLHNALKADQRTFDDYDQLKWCRENVVNTILGVTPNYEVRCRLLCQLTTVVNWERCKNSDCGIRGWESLNCRECFCSDIACRWKNEYNEFCKLL
ncbi:hypothetical protein LUZ63_001800 [Rhynchospora breviuscula]|uniref:At2g35280-like TPR domain-containing protein n=1 Tax=Rhynchospora breviuscula TaxID=2022672 RepID=A0A9Q0CXN5_9POAL|nr:hypothetical protein LUZ63_001800 [Rhynchospora breviuscula]